MMACRLHYMTKTRAARQENSLNCDVVDFVSPSCPIILVLLRMHSSTLTAYRVQAFSDSPDSQRGDKNGPELSLSLSRYQAPASSTPVRVSLTPSL